MTLSYKTSIASRSSASPVSQDFGINHMSRFVAIAELLFQRGLGLWSA